MVGERGFPSVSSAARSMPASAKAWSVGAKTVKDPALEGFQEFSLNDGGYEEAWSPALSSPWNVVGCVSGHQHFVNDMDEAIAGNDVRHNDVRIVHHHAVANREGQRLSICSVGLHTIRDVGGRTSALQRGRGVYRRVWLCLRVSSEARSIPASAKAWSVGAKTVNGLSPERVASKSAWITAETKES